MHKILTTELLDSLLSQGYLYCLSRTTAILGEDADRCIMLVPVKQPFPGKIPEPFDSFFKIGEELHQMAMGVDETIILVDLSETSDYTEMI